MKLRLVIAALYLLSSYTYAGPYEDCVLTGMKGVSSDAAARAVSQACASKRSEIKREKQEKFGFAMKSDEYTWNEGNTVGAEKNGYLSEIIKNKSSYKTITYVALEVLDADYYDFKQPKWPAFDFEGESAWKKERSKTYYYKLSLKPNAMTKLLYRAPRTDTFWANITMVLGRESKWSDSISTSVWSDTVEPEPKDPLE